MLSRFHSFLQEINGGDCAMPDTTLIFDKGNNSTDNFSLLDSLQLSFVGSTKLQEHKDLAQIPNDDPIFKPCQTPGLEGTKAFRVNKKVYGRERILVVTYNENLFNTQCLSVHNDIAQAVAELASLKEKLDHRACGAERRGKDPTTESVEKQCRKILSRQYMKQVIQVQVSKDRNRNPRLDYAIDAAALYELSNTTLGKNIIITNRPDWDNAKILEAYRSQFIIEDIFKEMKDRTTGNWWPLHHWTDSKIKVHGLYCTIALLLRALMLRRVRAAGLDLSMKRVLSQLDAIRQVINIYPRQRRQKHQRKQAVLTKTSDLQQELMTILSLKQEENDVLG